MTKYGDTVKVEIGRSQYPTAVAEFKSAVCKTGHCKGCSSLRCSCPCHALKAGASARKLGRN